jgi:light-regulated signal transduction histidine kinase (bacteriophytochrome)
MTEPVNLTNCDREPIHIPGAIQGHGAMLVCDPKNYRLRFASKNAASLLGYKGSLEPGLALSAIVGERAAHDILNAAVKATRPQLPGLALRVTFPNAPGEFDARVHTFQERAFVEIEPCLDEGRSAQVALDLTQTLIRRIGLETDVQGIAAAGAALVRAMLGYDRVMVYRFLHNGAGRVIAEARSPNLGTFLGQHFPASDIPYQARRLYLLNTIRMIGDSRYTPVPLEPALAPNESPIDMSFAQLRSVSPIHCEYLQNMGVSASMSVSIVVDEELWGLISCHHDTPRIVPMPLRVGAELFGHYFSLQISVAERRQEMRAAAEARERLDKIISDLSIDGAAMTGIIDHLGDFATLLVCDGVGLWAEGKWHPRGSALDEQSARSLIDLIAMEGVTMVWKTNELRGSIPSAVGTPVAGVLVIPISFVRGDYLIVFRNEEAHAIEWAGEPSKKSASTLVGERLTPRGSFETWREEVRHRSTPWTSADLSVAEAIRTYLRDVVLKQSEITAVERARTEQRRRILNDELNHRVKNIMALVKSIALQTGARASTVAEYSTALEGRLNALAFAHDQSLTSGGGDVATLIEAEAGLHRYGMDPNRIVSAGESLRLNDRAFSVLALVVHEMMTNAAKYGALSTSRGRLEICWRTVASGGCELVWAESEGPAVAIPTREGFGTKLIKSTIEYDLQGKAEVKYEKKGLRARFFIPQAYLSSAPSDIPSPKPPEPISDSLEGLSILVVEDQSLIAMDIEETLRRSGAHEVFLAASVENAVEQLSEFTPDVAVLDFSLSEGTSESVADVLTSKGVPFLFATGYGDRAIIPERFEQVAVIRKPVSSASLATQVLAVCNALTGSNLR